MEIILLWVIVGVVVLAAVLAGLKRRSATSDKNDEWPFYAKRAMSAPEQILYFRLKEALPENMILAQVQLSRLLGVKKGNNYQAWLNRINRMSADFVVCKQDSSVVAVVELDDDSHKRTDRVIADTKKDRALASAGIKVMRWKCSSIPDVVTIRKNF